MDDAFGVACVQSVGNLDSEIEHRIYFQRFIFD